MNEPERMRSESEAHGTEAGDDRLRALYAAADLPLKPPEELDRRVAALAAQHDSRATTARVLWPLLPFRFRPAIGAVGAVFFLVFLMLALTWWGQSWPNRLVRQPGRRQIVPTVPPASQDTF